MMAIRTKYRIKNANGKYEVMHFETSVDQVVTTDEKQFISKQEKENLNKPKHYIHNQLVSTEEWIITHNLEKFPSVSIVDSAGTLVVGDIIHTNENQLKVKFSSAFSGKAYLN